MSDHYVKFAREISNNVELLNKNFEKQNKLLEKLILVLFTAKTHTTQDVHKMFSGLSQSLEAILND